MYQRSSLLIAGATLVTGVQATRFPSAINSVESAIARWGWPSMEALHASGALFFAVAATVFALIAAILGIRAITVETGDEIDVQKFAINALSSPADTYTVQWSLVRDKLQVHEGDMLRLEARRRLFTIGAAMLVVSWSLAIIHFALSGR